MKRSLAPTLILSALLHVGLIALLIFLMPPPGDPGLGSAVPVTIVSDGPDTAPEISDQPAPEPAPAAEPAPTPTPPPPAETKPQPTPKKPVPVTPTTHPQHAAQPSRSTTPAETFDPAKIAKQFGGAGAKTNKPSTSQTKHGGGAQPGPEVHVSGADLKGMVDKIIPLWTVDCEVVGNRHTVARVHFILDASGRFTDGPYLVDLAGARVGGGSQAATSALTALKRGQPYSAAQVPMKARNQAVTTTFHADQACTGR